MKHRTQRGFTLLELMVVIAIFPMIMLATYSVLSASHVIFQTNDVYSRLNQSGMQTLRFINREIGQTSPNVTPSHLTITTVGGNSIVRFQIPVDWDNDGDVVTGTLNPSVEWGAYPDAGQVQGGNLGGWAQYWAVNNQLVRDVLDITLVPNPALRRIVANNVQTFTVTQNQRQVTMTMTVVAADTIGQSGMARNLQTTFTDTTLLRNAVN